jgi:hypothetical protein
MATCWFDGCLFHYPCHSVSPEDITAFRHGDWAVSLIINSWQETEVEWLFNFVSSPSIFDILFQLSDRISLKSKITSCLRFKSLDRFAQFLESISSSQDIIDGMQTTLSGHWRGVSTPRITSSPNLDFVKKSPAPFWERAVRNDHYVLNFPDKPPELAQLQTELQN